MVLGSAVSPHTRRLYAKALDDLFALSAGRPLTRSLLMEYRATMATLSSSTVNVRLSAIRKMVWEARKNGLLGAEEAANLTGVPNCCLSESLTHSFPDKCHKSEPVPPIMGRGRTTT